MSNDSSARFRRFRFHASALQGRGRGRKSRPVTSAENQIALPNVAKSQLDKPSRKPEPKRATVAFALSLAFHMLLGTCVVKLIHQHHMENQPFEESIQVRWVPPPSVRLKVRPREISKEIPKVFSTQQKAPLTPTTKLARRSPQPIAEVVVKGPEIVRESVEIHRDTPVSQILPVVKTAA